MGRRQAPAVLAQSAPRPAFCLALEPVPAPQTQRSSVSRTLGARPGLAQHPEGRLSGRPWGLPVSRRSELPLAIRTGVRDRVRRWAAKPRLVPLTGQPGPGAACPPTLAVRPAVLACERGWPLRRPPPGTRALRTRLRSPRLRAGPVAAATGAGAASTAEAGAGRPCPAPRAPRSPATRSRAGDTAAAVFPSPAPRARGPRPAEREQSRAKSTRPEKSQGLKPSAGCRTPAGSAACPGGSPRPSGGPWLRGREARGAGSGSRGGDAAGSPARSTLHPPGHGPERLRDRRRVGAGNYKSNPSSRGVKLQRKRTSQGKKKRLPAAA